MTFEFILIEFKVPVHIFVLCGSKMLKACMSSTWLKMYIRNTGDKPFKDLQEVKELIEITISLKKYKMGRFSIIDKEQMNISAGAD